jgi:hypothetical protein
MSMNKMSKEICQLKATIAGRIGSHALSPLSPQGSLYLQTKVRVYNSSHNISTLEGLLGGF